MSAIRMESHNDIVVLINPLKDESRKETQEGIFLTRHYKNPNGVLPEEHIFISNNERWFYWLGYYKDWQKEYKPITEENIDIEGKIIDYINEYSSGNQLDIAMQIHCKNCNKQDTLYCQTTCNYGAI